MIFGSAVSVLAVSSSAMPFLNALMPWATSPISSEILPRPNTNRTTAMTMIQCQILKPPIDLSSVGGRLKAGRRHALRGRNFQLLLRNLGPANGKNKVVAGALLHRAKQRRKKVNGVAPATAAEGAPAPTTLGLDACC